MGSLNLHAGLSLKEREHIKELKWLARNRRWEEAVRLMSLEAQPSPIFRTSVLDACTKSMQPDAAWQIFSEMPVKTMEAYGSLVDLMGRLRRTKVAEDLVSEMQENILQPNHVIYTSLITAYGHGQNIDKVFDTLEQMKAEGLPVDRITYAAAMAACARAGDKDSTWNLFRSMVASGVEVQITHLTSLIVSCAQTKDEARAREALAEISNRGIPLDKVVYTAFIQSLPAKGPESADAALAVLREMRSKEVLPNTYTYNAALQVASESGAEDCFQKLLAEMEVVGLLRNRETEFRISRHYSRAEEEPRQQEEVATSHADIEVGTVPPLPVGWLRATDPSTGRAYYWQEVNPSGTVTWDRPPAK